MKSPRNIPASVRQRLLNRAKKDQRPFNELLQYFAIERFLYRLSKSSHADRYILKGALMLRVWHSPELRPTMDIDMMGRTSNEEADIVAQIRDILTVEVETDGLAFDPDSIQAERITEEADLIKRNHGIGKQISITYRSGPFLRKIKFHKLDCTRPMDLRSWISKNEKHPLNALAKRSRS